MFKRNETYKCPICGGIAHATKDGSGTLTCCGKPMIRQKDNFVDADVEKHLPVVTKTDNGLLVKVGEVAHPMINEHYIEWIEIIADNGNLSRKFLNPGDEPEATFVTNENIVEVKAYCNLHGLWSTKL